MSATWDCRKCDAIVLGSRCPRCEPDAYDSAAVRELVDAARRVLGGFERDVIDWAGRKDRLRAALETFEEKQ